MPSATPKLASVIRNAFGCLCRTRLIIKVAATPRMAVPATIGTATGTVFLRLSR